jgi:hypothetical protein
MLDNNKLNKRLNRIFKELKDLWGLTSYRIAVGTGIPHSSLKYMRDGKFEWKLNHLLAVVDFLNRHGAKISLKDLLEFDEKKSLSQILNMEKADFRGALVDIKIGRGNKSFKPKKVTETKPIDPKKEVDLLTKEIAEVVKENRLYKKSKISVGLKINGKDINFQKEIKF